MKRVLIALVIIFGIGTVAALDKPEDRHLPELTRAEHADALAAYTTIDEYQHVSLIAASRKGGKK